MQKLMTFPEFKEKYSSYREQVYKAVPNVLNMPHIKLTPINNEALSQNLTWYTSGRKPPNGGWDWGSWVSQYRRKHHKRFEAAIWYGKQLCGLCLGKASGNNIHVRLEILEGSPSTSHPLRGRIALIALTATELYGYACGASEVRIIDPVQGAVNSYKALGYTLKPGTKYEPRYLVKNLT